MGSCMAITQHRFTMIAAIGLACLAAPGVCVQAKPLVSHPVLVINPRLTALAVPDFAAADPQLRQAAIDMARFIGDSLQRSCQFKLIGDTGEQPAIDAPPDYSFWRSVKVDVLVVGRLTGLPDGRIRVEARAWDVSPSQPIQLYGQQFTASPDAMQRLGYILAGNMFERLCRDDKGFTRTPE